MEEDTPTAVPDASEADSSFSSLSPSLRHSSPRVSLLRMLFLVIISISFPCLLLLPWNKQKHHIPVTFFFTSGPGILEQLAFFSFILIIPLSLSLFRVCASRDSIRPRSFVSTITFSLYPFSSFRD